ncbi:MAG TPA: DinB family protein [Puia sp.]|nr:DinB family protein [Puia sp.]
MEISKQIAELIRGLYFGGNWTDVNLKDVLKDISWQQANEKVGSHNTIAALVYHINYYVEAVSGVLREEPLSSSDKYSFDHRPIPDQRAWQQLLDKTWADAERFAVLVENLPEDRLWETFASEQHGNYYRNIHGVIEHGHYHLGQIVLIGKLLAEASA